jgi:hypothetical protein
MKMDVEIERPTKSLDQSHCTRLCRGFCKARFVRQVRGDGAIDNAQYPGQGSLNNLGPEKWFGQE